MNDQQANKAIVERFIDEYYRKGNLDIFDELLAPDFVFAGVGAEFQGDIAALKEMAAATHSMLHTAVPDLEVTIDEIVAEGNSVVVRLTQRGTLTGPYVAGPFRVEPTGKQAQVTAMEWFHIEDGKIVRRWATRDRLGFLQQVGAPIQIG